MRYFSLLFLVLYACIYRLHEAEIGLVSRLSENLKKWRPEWPELDFIGIDVGANLGAYSLVMSRFCRQVFAIEPNVNVLRHLEHARLPNCKIITAAASYEEGNGLLVDENVSGWRRPTAHIASENNQINAWSAPCRLITIDSILDAANLAQDRQITLVKIDAEQHELAVLEGMKNTLAGRFVILIIELQNTGTNLHTDVVTFLEAFGYEGFVYRSGHLEALHLADIPEIRDTQSYRFARLRGIRNNFVFLKK